MASAQSPILRPLYVELILAIDHKMPIKSKTDSNILLCFCAFQFSEDGYHMRDLYGNSPPGRKVHSPTDLTTVFLITHWDQKGPSYFCTISLLSSLARQPLNGACKTWRDYK